MSTDYFNKIFKVLKILKIKKLRLYVNVKYKNKYINKALKGDFEHFKYSYKTDMNRDVLELLGDKDNSLRKYKIIDEIEGRYKNKRFIQRGVLIEDVNIKNKKSTKDIFNGVITEFDLDKDYGKILIVTKNMECLELREKVEVEDREFNTNFEVTIDDLEKALMFLSPKIIEGINYLVKEEILVEPMFIMIDNNKLYLGQECVYNLFDPNYDEKINEVKVVDNIKDTMLYIKKVIGILI